MISNQNRQSAPILYESKETCCGCSACYAICPAEAISMLSDDEGFLYPVINMGKCIKCFKCLSVCGFKIDQKSKGLFNNTGR